jgi:peptidoglycan/LPS O-acetylase OafA/YrhL
MAARFASEPVATEGVRAEIGDIRAIEGLRGVAVLWVVLFHYLVLREGKFADPLIDAIIAFRPLHVLIRNGYLGVDLFFLITGFLLTLPWFKHALEGKPAPSIREFYRRRVRRIVPAYYVQLAFLAIVCLPVLMSWRFVKAELAFVIANLVAHATFLHYTSPLTSASLTINGALWTLAIEFQYYLLLPFIAPLFVRWPRSTFAAFVTAALAWRYGSAHGFEPLVDFYKMLSAHWNTPEARLRALISTQLPGYLAHFAVGILCGRAWLAKRVRRPGAIPAAALAVATALSCLALFGFLAAGRDLAGEHTWLLFPILMGAAMFCAVSCQPKWGDRLLGAPPIAWAGKVSYSTYLYHVPLLLLFNKLLPAADGWLAFPFWFSVLMGVSWASHRFVELPFMRGRTPALTPQFAAAEMAASHGKPPYAVGTEPR